MDSYVLRHYGIKGMKWGHRRRQKRPSEMSADEIDASIKRMRLEKQYEEKYKESVAAYTLDKDRAIKFVNRVLEKSGDKLLSQLGNYYGIDILDKNSGEEDDDDD